jgi:hypothetical protein
MTDPMTNIRQLPIYQDGYRTGLDTGLRLALDQLTRERKRQEAMLARGYPSSIRFARISYADAILIEVSKQVAGIFRQETSR